MSSFLEIAQNKISTKKEIIDEKVKPGWTVIKLNKNNKTSNISILESEKTKQTKIKYANKEKKREELKQYNAKIKMINNWNDYVEGDINLYGDRSQYLSYKNEIDNMIDEDNNIQKMIELYNSNLLIDSDSDEESNKHLIY